MNHKELVPQFSENKIYNLVTSAATESVPWSCMFFIIYLFIIYYLIIFV